MIGGSEASKVISHYTWQGKQETSDEVLCIFKTRAALFEDIEKDVASKHPYDCPEIIAMAACNKVMIASDNSVMLPRVISVL